MHCIVLTEDRIIKLCKFGVCALACHTSHSDAASDHHLPHVLQEWFSAQPLVALVVGER